MLSTLTLVVARPILLVVMIFSAVLTVLWTSVYICALFLLRANVGIYRESQISCEKSNFGLYHPNNPLEWLFQKMILKNPQALYI